MLSLARIGKCASGYYLGPEITEAFGTTESPTPHWLGTGAERLGLTGIVQPEAFQRVWDGWHPTRPEALVRNAGSIHRRPALDCCFTLDKTVSLFWALASKAIRQEIEAIQWMAVRQTLRVLEQEYAVSRQGAGGTERVPALVIAAGFPHGASRNLDPNLHQHIVLCNLGVRPDSSTGALTTRPIFLAKQWLGCLFRIEIALHLTYRLGIEVQWEKSLFRIPGVPESFVSHFSSRRQEILTALEQKGLSSSHAAAINCLETRAPKREVERDMLFRSWQRIGHAYGFGIEEAHALLHRCQPHIPLETARKEWLEHTRNVFQDEREKQHLAEIERLSLPSLLWETQEQEMY